MDFQMSGATAEDTGPLGCVARFILAGVAGDTESAEKELHPDARAGISGGVKAPPGITAAAVGAPEEKEDGIHVPTQLTGPDGTEQRFVFVVRPYADRMGIDLDLSMKATFGGDPFQAMTDALRSAVEPLGEAMSGLGQALGDAMGDAFGGSSGGGDSSAPVAKRLALDEPIPGSSVEPPSSVVTHLLEAEMRRRIQRSDATEEFQSSSEVSVKCRLEIDPAWSVQACKGVTLDAATSIEGEDLKPEYADESYGSESYASWERERRDFYFKLPLGTPKGDFSGIAALSGTVRLAAVGGELYEVVLGPVGELLGRSVPLAAFGVEVAFERDESGSLTLRAPSAWFDRMSEIAPTGAGGESLGDGWSQSGDGETNTRVYGIEIPDDASLVARFWGASGELSIPFAVEGLPVRLS